MIGELKEKKLHSYLKKYFESNEKCHEIKIGPYYADIFRNNEIIEIQTQSMNKLREKVLYYLENYKVRVVYPVCHIKYLEKIDEDGVKKNRKSPKVGRIFDAIKEMYRIKPIIDSANLIFTIVLIDAKETRLVTKKNRKGYSKVEIEPIKVFDIVNFYKKEDYDIFISGLKDEFTSKDLSKEKKITRNQASVLLGILRKVGAVEVVEKKGREYVYTKII